MNEMAQNSTNDEILTAPRRKPAREAIFSATCELVARKGPLGTTVRDITSASGANVAAVNYYFQSKDNLVALATEEITRKINVARLVQLEAALHASQGQPLAAEAILRALIEPILHVSRAEDGGSLYVRNVFHIRTAPNADLNISQYQAFGDTAQRFIHEIGRSFPDLSPQQLVLNYEFARGVALHMVMNLDPLSRRFDRMVSKATGDVLCEPETSLDQAAIDTIIAMILKSFGRP